jgi:transposase
MTVYPEALEQTLGAPARIVCCYAAGHDGFWLHRLLSAHGIENHVMDPAGPPVDRRARRAKTGRLDLAALLRALTAWGRVEKQLRRMVRQPCPEREDRRRRSLERERLVKDRVQHIACVNGLLMIQVRH